MTPTSRCRIPWCISTHKADRGHYGHSTTVAGVTVTPAQGFVDGAFWSPLIRTAFPVDGQPRELDLSPQLARDLADMLAAVGPEWVEAFCDALRAAADTLGGAA
ncbi:hypothetical protein [Nonomuraea sp. NPDC049480]|uniref:hypothetical protein n=1 Tax=Nonomuraea sp. NPDC049480 TaxID=3364353 RepID=UPI0037A4B756